MRKLVSRKGTLLGVVTYPADWERWLADRQSASFHVAPNVFVRAYEKFDPNTELLVKTGTLVRSLHMRDAVELYGISIEEFEQLDGCTFSPSAAYLRSIVE